MMRNLPFLLFLLLPLAAAYGQQQVSIHLEQQPATELFRLIEQQTQGRVFCLPHQADSLRVSLHTEGEAPLAALRKALEGTGLKVAQYENDFLITREAELMTALPQGYFSLSARLIESRGAPTVFEQPRVQTDEPDMRTYALDEVVVSSARAVENVRSVTLGVERLEAKAIKNIPTVFGERDIMRVISSLPGVKTAGEASSGFNVRGGATDQNLILFNGGTIYNPSHLFGFFSAINSEVTQDMELYKSSIPARYGGRISSVLDINGREGDRKAFKGSAGIGLLTSQLAIEGPLFSEKTSYLLAGRTSYSDWILGTLPEKSDYRDGSAGFYDLNATLSHRFSNYNSLILNGYFSRDRFSFKAGERYAYRNANASARWRHFFTPELIASLSAGYDHYDYQTQRTDVPTEAYTLNFDINQYYARLDMSRYAGSHTIEFGLNSLFFDLNPGRYLPSGEASLVADDRMEKEKALESALYLSDRWEISEPFSVEAGIRYTLFNALGPRNYYVYGGTGSPTLSTVEGIRSVGSGQVFQTYHGPEFRLSARYELTGGLSLKAGFNSMRQNIHKLSNTTIMAPTDTWKLSDVNIRPQTGSQLTAGLYKNIPAYAIEASVEGYYKTMNDYLDYRSGAQLLMNHHIETDVVTTRGRAYGLEVMIRKTAGMLNGWLSYTYSRTKLTQGDSWYPADYDKPHDIKLVGNYKFTHRYSLSVNLDYSTGRPITLPVSKYNYADGEFVYISDRNQYRIPDFFRMDMAINIEPSHRLTLLTHSSFSVGVYNVTGRRNAYSVYYVAEDGKLNGYQLSVFGVPIPYVSYNIRF
jgi:outer membrane receptor for ferrienterochelin and colicin